MAEHDKPHDQGAPSIVVERPTATQRMGGVAVGHSTTWPGWASTELTRAVEIAAQLPPTAGTAVTLYREWFNPAVEPATAVTPGRPLVGVYRGAHAANGAHTEADGLYVADRRDVVGSDGWWRTWGDHWTPPRRRPGTLRLFFTPRSAELAGFVHAVTHALRHSDASWTLSCATDPRRMRRCAGATLDVADLDVVPVGLLERLAPVLHPIRPPLTLPLGDGVGLASYPANGMSFGEYRCRLIALALRHPSSSGDPLRAIAAVFAAHGVDPSRPHRCS